MSHKPHSAADLPADWLCFVAFASSAAAALHSKLKVRIRIRGLVSKGPLADPDRCLTSPREVSHKQHSAADLRADLLRFVEFVSSEAAALRSKRKVQIRLKVCLQGASGRPWGVSHKPQGAVSQATLGGRSPCRCALTFLPRFCVFSGVGGMGRALS